MGKFGGDYMLYFFYCFQKNNFLPHSYVLEKMQFSMRMLQRYAVQIGTLVTMELRKKRVVISCGRGQTRTLPEAPSWMCLPPHNDS